MGLENAETEFVSEVQPMVLGVSARCLRKDP
jgi:hypothetical protein